MYCYASCRLFSSHHSVKELLLKSLSSNVLTPLVNLSPLPLSSFRVAKVWLSFLISKKILNFFFNLQNLLFLISSPLFLSGCKSLTFYFNFQIYFWFFLFLKILFGLSTPPSLFGVAKVPLLSSLSKYFHNYFSK